MNTAYGDFSLTVMSLTTNALSSSGKTGVGLDDGSTTSDEAGVTGLPLLSHNDPVPSSTIVPTPVADEPIATFKTTFVALLGYVAVNEKVSEPS